MGNDTLRLQMALKAAGEDPGPLDGNRGPKTREALRRWAEKAHTWAHGIDVSQYQTSIDWAACKAAGVSFVAIRASVSNSLDKLFLQHMVGAKAAGIPRFAYHFFAPWRNAKEQASLFASRLLQNGTELPPVLDVEAVAPKAKEGQPAPVPVSRQELIDKTAVCLEDLEKFLGRVPVFYTYSAFARQYKLSEVFGKKYKIWIADYREGPPTAPEDWPWLIHQYEGDGGRQVGVKGPCDLNRVNGSMEDLIEALQ